MNLRTVIQAFRKDAEYLPIEPPKLPQAPSREASEEETIHFKKRFESFEDSFYETMKENNKRFEVAMGRIGLCAFLHGMSDPFAQDISARERHYKWCPQDAWSKHSSNIGIQMETED